MNTLAETASYETFIEWQRHASTNKKELRTSFRREIVLYCIFSQLVECEDLFWWLTFWIWDNSMFLLYWLYLPHLINGGSGWSVGKETPHWKNTYFVCRFPQNAAAEYRDIWWFNNAGSPKTATVQIEPIISDYVVKDHWYKWYYSWCDRKLLL